MHHHHTMKFDSHKSLVIINFVMLLTIVVLCVLLVKNKCYRNCNNTESFRGSLVGDTESDKYTYFMSPYDGVQGPMYLDIIKETQGSEPVTYKYFRQGTGYDWKSGGGITPLSAHTT